MILTIYIVSSTSCDGGWSLGGYTYDCKWREDKNAILIDAQLCMPYSDETSGYRFENDWLKMSLGHWSIVRLMEEISQYGIGTNFTFKWTVTLASNKTCYDSKGQSKSIVLDKDSYKSRMRFVHGDVISETPYVSEQELFYPRDHKHELIFQIFDVENTYEKKFGTMTWKITWANGPTMPKEKEWEFKFPDECIIGTFSPNHFNGRYMYINGKYELL